LPAAPTSACAAPAHPALIFAAIADHGVTHMCGAPVVLSMLIHAPSSARRPFAGTVEIATGGAAPPSTVITRMEAMGFAVTHLYGLTESYGPSTVCLWQPGLDDLPINEKSAFVARQGVNTPMLEQAAVLDPATMQPMPGDGATMGELMLRGNTIMMGYLKNLAATEAALAGGWFHTGDLAVTHPDGYWRSRIAPRTSSFRAAKTFLRWKSKKSSTSIPPSWKPPSLLGRTKNGGRRRRPS
jgi:fatty-acyl-CoA synthase